MIYSKRRNEFEIIHELLTHAMKGAKKTFLMYQTNMSYSQFNHYLDSLLGKKLLEKRNWNSNGRLYFTTEKGKKLLDSVTETFKLAR